MPLFCGCVKREKKPNRTEAVDQEDAYFTVPPSTSNAVPQAPLAAFQRAQPDADPDEPSLGPRADSNNPSKRNSFGFSWGKMKGLKGRKLPNPPEGSPKGRFGRPGVDEPVPTYESIDVDSNSDVMYSKVDEKTRYDYPSFNSRPLNRRKPPAEALYASASQTYSLNSDDPYSSIASDAGHVRAANEDTSVGYARVQDSTNRRPPPKGFPAHNVDDLYAKVNRKPFDRVAQLNGNLPSTSSGASRFTLQQVQPSTSGLFNTYADDPYQMEESGSGSITSNESRQPSYRYLTVRESLGVIRERILRRNEENQSTEGNSQKEHYYSTISNDYESVRNEEEGPSTAITIPRPRISPINPQVVPAAYSGTIHTNLPLAAGSSETHLPVDQPPVPTSPVPNRTPSSSMLEENGGQKRSSAMVRSCCDECLSLLRSPASVTPAPLLSTRQQSKGVQTIVRPALISARLPPLPSGRTALSSELEVRIAHSHSTDTRPIVVSLANILRRGGSAPDVNSSTFVEDVRLPLTHRHLRSRIPLPINRRPLLRPATHSPKKANTSNNKIKSRSRSPLFLPVGSDYVSVLDLDEGKCWPLDRTL